MRTAPAINALGLGGGDDLIGGHPGDLLADRDHLEQVRVQAGALAGLAEGGLVQMGRAGGHHHAGQAQLLDVILDHLLAQDEHMNL